MSDPKKLNANPDSPQSAQDSGDLSDSSVNAPDAVPGEPNPRGEGHRRIPDNDQAEGLKKAEQAGKQTAKP